jgi:hypothetical protein
MNSINICVKKEVAMTAFKETIPGIPTFNQALFEEIYGKKITPYNNSLLIRRRRKGDQLC